MKNIAILKYSFMFDPVETWTNLFQFEADLRVFFESKGMEINVVKPVEGSGGERIMMIDKKVEIETTADTPKEKSVLQQKASLTSSRGFDGKFK